MSAPRGPAPAPSGLERVLAGAARRLERNGLQPAGRLRLERVTPAEIAALSGLLGTRWRAVAPGATASVDLAALDAALLKSARACALVEAAGRAAGAPLVDRSAARFASAAARDRGWAALDRHGALRRHAELAGWLARERRSGAAARAGQGQSFALLATALDVLAALPADPPQTLARFAARHCAGDPHALDRGRPLDGAVRRALAHLDGDSAPRDGAEARRERYDRWGLGCDELSSAVLCLGLRAIGSAPLADALRTAAEHGEPRVVTLRELRGLEVLECGPVAFCCENPDVVAAAADALGAQCPALVCTGGWPSTAALRLLRALVAGGASLHLHGDMDADGLRILRRVIDLTGGRPWRMDAGTYERHAAAGEPSPAPPSGWVDAIGAELREVADAITTSARAVPEELVLDELLADLRAAAARDHDNLLRRSEAAPEPRRVRDATPIGHRGG